MSSNVRDPRTGSRPHEPRRDRPMSAGQVMIVGIIAFGVAALLNSQTLLDMANRQPFNSATRGIALAITKPLHAIAGGLQLTRPGEAIGDVRGSREGGTGEFGFGATTTVASAAAAGRHRCDGWRDCRRQRTGHHGPGRRDRHHGGARADQGRQAPPLHRR